MNMGDKGQVLIKDTGVYLYTYWGGSELQNLVRIALKRNVGWGDVEYLTRIIFDTMSAGEQGEGTGGAGGVSITNKAEEVSSYP